LPANAFALLERPLNWPVRHLFGVLGLFRLLVLRSETSAYYSTRLDQLVPRLYPLIPSIPSASSSSSSATASSSSSAAPPTTSTVSAEPKAELPPPSVQVMALCTLSNLLSAIPKLATDDALLQCGIRGARSADKSILLVAGTLLANCALCTPKPSSGTVDVPDNIVEVVTVLAEAVNKETDVDAGAQLLHALGLYVVHSSACSLIVSALDFDAETITKRLTSAVATNVVTPGGPVSPRASANNAARCTVLLRDIRKIILYEQQSAS